MLSKNQIKLLRSLQRKKNRQQEGLFLVEGGKAVLELLASGWPLHSLYVSEEFAAAHQEVLPQSAIRCSAEGLAAAGTLVSNRDALAVALIAEQTDCRHQPGQWTLVLDRINDPGNLGTLLRIADWYGIKQIICSPDTVDVYNPKVINASMGSCLRVQVAYQPLEQWLVELPAGTPVLGAYLDGESVHHLLPMVDGGVLLMGSEAHGLASGLASLVTQRITIPAFGTAESLNVAVATAVICDNLKRLQLSV